MPPSLIDSFGFLSQVRLAPDSALPLACARFHFPNRHASNARQIAVEAAWQLPGHAGLRFSTIGYGYDAG